MISTFRLLLGFVGLTGVGSAISVPLALSSSRDGGDSVKDAQGGGTIQVSDFLGVDRCNNSDSLNTNEVNFGEKSVDKVCGKIESAENIQIENDVSPKYTNLFQKMGNQKQGSGSMYSEYGRRDCPYDKKWIFSNQKDDEEYLGLCNNLNHTSNYGIMVENKNRDNPEILTCTGDCFESKEVAEGKKLESSKKREKAKGSKVKFKKIS